MVNLKHLRTQHLFLAQIEITIKDVRFMLNGAPLYLIHQPPQTQPFIQCVAIRTVQIDVGPISIQLNILKLVDHALCGSAAYAAFVEDQEREIVSYDDQRFFDSWDKAQRYLETICTMRIRLTGMGS